VSSKPFVEPNVIYSRQEAAQMLGVSLATLKQMIRAGHLDVSRPAGIRRVFIRRACILDMLERTNHGSDTESLNSILQPSFATPAYRAAIPMPLAGTKPAASWNQPDDADALALRPRRATNMRRPPVRTSAPNHGGANR
jgi:excisionase family DNA binding protein